MTMVELAEDEVTNFAKVWASVFLSLSYCYVIGKVTPKGFRRFLVTLPIISLFFILPLKLTSLHFCGFTAFFITWLANFKLLLFAFGKPPLSSDTPISFPRFLALSCLPIKIQNSSKSQNGRNPEQAQTRNKPYPPPKMSRKSQNLQTPDQKRPNKLHPTPQKLPWNYILKGALLALILRIYSYTDQIPQKLLWIVFFFHIYLELEIILALLAKATQFFLGLELEPQFNEPLLSTSLQDFWGRRWNLMVTGILRPTVFKHTQDLSTRVVGPQLGRLSAVMATFAVSALMHELIFFYLGRVRPTFEVTWFFLFHGFCICLEIAAKKYLAGKWRVPRWFSGPVTITVLLGTAFWLFLPPLLRAGLDSKGIGEYAVAGAFVRRVVRRVVGTNGGSSL